MRTFALVVSLSASPSPVAVVVAISAPTPEAAVDLGTTLVAVKYHGGVVVAADSQTSLGRYVSNREAEKLERFITDSCFILRSGSAAETQFLVRAGRQYFQNRSRRYSLSTTTPTVSQVAHWMRRAVVSINKNRNAGTVSLIVAGYDKTTTNSGDDDDVPPPTPQIYSIYPSGALISDDESVQFAVAGSGSTYILGFLDHEIQRKLLENKKNSGGDGTSKIMLTQSQAIHLCKRAVDLAIARDGSSGGQIRICILDGVSQTLSTREFNSQQQQTTATGVDVNKSEKKDGTFLPGFASPEMSYNQ